MTARTCAIAIVLAAMAGTAFAGPAKQTQAWIWCVSKERALLDQQVAGCTTVIESKKKKLRLGRIYNSRGVAYYRKGQYDLAIDDFDRAVQLGYSNALYNRSLAKEKLGDTTGAGVDFEAFKHIGADARH